MKQILITGVHSYVGNAIEKYLLEYNSAQGREHYRVDKISLKEDTWKTMPFRGYDVILHVAGIAHADIGKVSEETKALYYQINCNLALEVAEKAKAEGVSQFVYFSSVIVYGDSAGLGKQKEITEQTPPAPANFYGDSKWKAEQGLVSLQTEQFAVAVLRLPMVYGRGSRGNFPLLVKLADKMPVFPDIENQRSMIYVENLAEYVRLLTEQGRGGLFFPQNDEYVTTAHMVKAIGEVKGRRIRLWKCLNPLVHLAARIPGKTRSLANKAFGSLTIDRGLSNRDIQGYRIYSLKESIEKSVGSYEG